MKIISRWTWLGCLLVAGICAGCVSTRSDRLGGTIYPSKAPGTEIVLYDALNDVTSKYVKVGRIYGKGCAACSWERVVESMKDEARSLGADAIVLGDEETPVVAINEYGHAVRSKRKSALAIRYVSDSH